MDTAMLLSRWRGSGASERANYQLFLSELCDLLGVERPHPASAVSRDFVFERDVRLVRDDGSESIGRIDLYKRGCFVLEAKQGADNDPERLAELTERELRLAKKKRGHGARGSAAWDDAMYNARQQAERYARALPVEEGWPPFLVVVDVGHSIELFADFARSGKLYVPFPDPRSYRILLTDLEDERVRNRLRAVFSDPMSLDPARVAAAVTRAVAEPIAELARELEGAGHEPAAVAEFLMRALFTMFAEDVGMLPEESFTGLLQSCLEVPEGFQILVEGLWRDMDTGTKLNRELRRGVMKFNGHLFKRPVALPLKRRQIERLLLAARSDWRAVEPSIFGTLLERALDVRERHKLGAHYTPRAYVERLVFPTVIDPLREQWAAVRAEAVALAVAGANDKAVAVVRRFHESLCQTRVLDPACGTGNFLYVTMEHMKRLEGEVLTLQQELAGTTQELLELPTHTVDPHQFLGIEINPRAAAIAELVLWIGHLQWHYRTRTSHPAEPVLRAFGNIENRDAILAWDDIVPRRDATGNVVTRWDGVTTKTHPVTGEPVPDETAQIPVWDYVNPRKAEWPEAEYIVGNPPFLGNKRMREGLGDGYVEALRRTWEELGDGIDLVVYWLAGVYARIEEQRVHRAGLITTNSVVQVDSRAPLESYLERGAVHVALGVPDHPWVDSSSGAAVRIAMQVIAARTQPGESWLVERETVGVEAIDVSFVVRRGVLDATLRAGSSVSSASSLVANIGLTYMGVSLIGQGFVVEPGAFADTSSARFVRPYLIGRDLTQTPSTRAVIDLHGMSEADVLDAAPDAYQHLASVVRPIRATNPRITYRERWWIFGESRGTMRVALRGLPQYIATCRTAKHRTFTLVPADTISESTIIVIALPDGHALGVLSSRVHVTWATAAGGRLGVGNDPRYNNTLCFDPFPFPATTPEHEERIRTLGEQLDSFRKRQQAAHPGLTLTGMYNVLEALREGRELTKKEKVIHEQGLVSVLRQLHDDLDAAVLDAYGWPRDLDDEGILERLVGLNAERAAEEAQGHIRWLRPDYQRPLWEARQKGGKRRPTSDAADPDAEGEGAAENTSPQRPWPARLRDQVTAVREALAELGADATPAQVAALFEGASVEVVGDVMEVV